MKKGLEMLTVGFPIGGMDNSFVKVEQSKGPSHFPAFSKMPSQPLFNNTYYETKTELPKIKLGLDFEFKKQVYKKDSFSIDIIGNGIFVKIKEIRESMESYTFKKTWEAEVF